MAKTEEATITVALAGNPNSGKTTVFNQLTGARQHVGNWPGVTVEKKEGLFQRDGRRATIVDLPGTYSLTAYSLEEVIARDFIVEEKPDVVIHIVDASNLERNLYLTTQLLELGARVVVALNMSDVAESRGDRIDVAKMAQLLGCPVVPTVGHRGEGIEELMEAAFQVAAQPPPEELPHLHYEPEVEEEVTRLVALMAADPSLAERYPLRWLAVKLLEGDENVAEKVRSLSADGAKLSGAADESRRHLETIIGDDVEMVIADSRYGFIRGVDQEAVERAPGDRLTLSDQIDKVVTHRVLSLPIFLGLMWVTFQLTFTLGGRGADWIDAGIGWLGQQVAALLPEGPVQSLVVDGLIAGVGSVLVFLPNILLLFFMISLLEDSGYLARAAFIMDRIMHQLGLHGKSFIPLLIGFGCNVPAIMATRTLETRKDRLLTILITPLMSCSARLPIYVLLAGAFFPERGAAVILSLYLLGIVLAILMGKVFRHFLFPGEDLPLVMELPPYRWPTLKGTALHVWERGGLFVKRAGTIILAGSAMMWFLGTFPWGVAYASEQSYAGQLGHLLAPLVRPLGFDWKVAVALFFGFVAKEVVVTTLGILYGFGGEEVTEEHPGLKATLQGAMTPLVAYAFMVCSLIYVPCLATVAVIRRETGSWKWTAFAVGYGLVLAWIVTFLVYRGGLLLGLG